MSWNPITTTPDCDWCGECEWCDNLHRCACGLTDPEMPCLDCRFRGVA